MNQTVDDKINQFINSHPRESLLMVLVGVMLIWQTIPALIAILLYGIVISRLKINRLIFLPPALLLIIVAIYFSQHQISLPSVTAYFKQGFKYNLNAWHFLINNQPLGALLYAIKNASQYTIGSPLLLGLILSLTDLIQESPHEAKMKALQKGIIEEEEEVSEKTITKALSKLKDEDYNGTVLGVSKYTAKPIIIPDWFINQIALVLGTTGSGKTITLRRFYQRAIMKGYPLIIIDGKPDDANIAWIKQLADKYNRPFYGFNCSNFLSYDSLAHGNFTELKDKIICLKDQWENDYYRSIAEDYLQTTLEVLLKLGTDLDLKTIVDCLNYTKLKLLATTTKDEALIERVKELKNYERKDITGLQAHLNILINSELGRYFHKKENSFSLTDVLNTQGVVYFALPALTFPSFAKVLGKLVINDIKAVIARPRDNHTPVFTVFDEFSVFAGEQVLNLVNMGRGKGLHAIFSTQGLADLDKVDVSFKSQVMNCVNTLICQRLNDQDSVETVANWMGTQEKFRLTSQFNRREPDSGMGSVRLSNEFIVHPNMIKQKLGVGEAYLVSKVGGFVKEKVRVVYS